jgi:hypothetical protein
MTTFHTCVFYAPPTPLGLVPGRWVTQHRCTVCWREVPTQQLIAHAQTHPDPPASDSGNDDIP